MSKTPASFPTNAACNSTYKKVYCGVVIASRGVVIANCGVVENTPRVVYYIGSGLLYGNTYYLDSWCQLKNYVLSSTLWFIYKNQFIRIKG